MVLKKDLSLTRTLFQKYFLFNGSVLKLFSNPLYMCASLLCMYVCIVTRSHAQMLNSVVQIVEYDANTVDIKKVNHGLFSLSIRTLRGNIFESRQIS